MLFCQLHLLALLFDLRSGQFLLLLMGGQKLLSEAAELRDHSHQLPLLLRQAVRGACRGQRAQARGQIAGRGRRLAARCSLALMCCRLSVYLAVAIRLARVDLRPRFKAKNALTYEPDGRRGRLNHSTGSEVLPPIKRLACPLDPQRQVC